MITHRDGKGNPIGGTAITKDTLNYKGSSLFAAYKALWDAVHEYDMGIMPNNKRVQHAFDALATFPFEDVVNIMPDYIRKLVRAQLGLNYLPYTVKQLEAIKQLTTKYPTTKEEKTLINNLLTVINKLVDSLPNGKNILPSIPHAEVIQLIETLAKLLYTLNIKHLWIVSESALVALEKAKIYLGIPYPPVEAAIDYIKRHYALTGKPTKTMEQQLVDDISTLMMYQYPHPEMVLALENAERVLDVYYTETQASKLFVDDMRYRIKRYIGLSTEKLTARLVEWFRNKEHVPKVEEQKETAAEVYARFLKALQVYQLTAQGIQELLELAAQLKAMPYSEVANLKAFHENIYLVDRIKVQP